MRACGNPPALAVLFLHHTFLYLHNVGRHEPVRVRAHQMLQHASEVRRRDTLCSYGSTPTLYSSGVRVWRHLAHTDRRRAHIRFSCVCLSLQYLLQSCSRGDLSEPAAHYHIRNRPQALLAEAAAVDIRAVMYPSMLPVIDELSLPLV